MNIACIVPVSFKDSLKAYITYKCLPKKWKKYWIVESQDENLPVPKDVIKLVLPQNIKFYSYEYCKEYFNLLKKVKFDENDIIVKISPFAFLYEIDTLINPIINAGVDLSYVKNMLVNENNNTVTEICMDGCYAISSRCIECLNYEKNLLENIINKFKNAEDLILTTFLKNVKFPIISQIDHQLCDFDYREYNNNKAIIGFYKNFNNSDFINKINYILKIKNKKQIKSEDLTNYIKELSEL